MRTATSHRGAPYAGETIAVGTLHGKESAFAPAFARWLDAGVAPTAQLDTDSLGTFTRDVPRAGTAEHAATAKARGAALELGTATGLATEASYAPALGGFGPMVHEELAVFIDLERGIRVRHGIRQYTHVAPARTVRTSAEARRYLARAGFPHHGVVARTADGVQKGIQDAAVIDALLRRGPVELEPDLRAHMNPPGGGSCAACRGCSPPDSPSCARGADVRVSGGGRGAGSPVRSVRQRDLAGASRRRRLPRLRRAARAPAARAAGRPGDV